MKIEQQQQKKVIEYTAVVMREITSLNSRYYHTENII